MTKQGKRRLYNFLAVVLIINTIIPVIVFFTKIINDPKPLVANYRPGHYLHQNNDSEGKDLFEVMEIHSKPIPINTTGAGIDANNAGNNGQKSYTYSMKAFDDVNSENTSQPTVNMPSDFSTSAYQSKNKQERHTEEFYAANLPAPTISVRNFDQLSQVFASSPVYQDISSDYSPLQRTAPDLPPDPGVPVPDGMWLMIGFGLLYVISKQLSPFFKHIKQTFKY